ncbi:MAG: hypothetical protein ACTSYB_19180 [Candidatus Helarchaeota archaeon]
MVKSNLESELEKLLSKKVKYNRIEIQFNNKSIVIDYITPKKAVEHAVAYLFKVIEHFKYMGSIMNLGSDKYKTIDIKRYFAHPMLRSELFNIEKNLLLYGGTIKYGGRVYIEISPSPTYKGRLVIKTKTAWKKDDFLSTLDSLTGSFKVKTPPKIINKLSEIIDQKIALEKEIREKKREEFLKKRKEELEQKIREEKEKLAKLAEQERLKQEQEKEKKMKEWRIKKRLFPIEDLASINWDKRWIDDFDVITKGISNVKINSLEDEEFLRDYCDKVIDFILNLDVYTIKNDPDIKNMMIRRIHESKKEAIMKVMEPEPEVDENIELRLQELIKQLPTAPIGTMVQPKPVPLEEEESEEKAEEREQREVPLSE